MKNNHYFTLCTKEEVSDYIGIGVRTINDRWLKNKNKQRQYNGIQTITFLNREGIDEDTLKLLVGIYKGIINNKGVTESIVKRVLDKGLSDA